MKRNKYLIAVMLAAFLGVMNGCGDVDSGNGSIDPPPPAIPWCHHLVADQNTVALYYFDGMEGDTIADASGNGWDGTVIGGATLSDQSSCGIGKSIHLDGVNDYVSIDPTLLNNLPHGTIEIYFYLESLDPNPKWGAQLFSKGSTTFSELYFGIEPDQTVCTIMGNHGEIHSVSTVPLNAWTKVALSWDGANWRLYINDVLDKTTANTSRPDNENTKEVKIGRHNHSTGPHFFHGYIDEVRVSNIAR